MVARSSAPTSFHQLDAGVLFVLGIVQSIGIGTALLLAGLTFLSWTAPAFVNFLPNAFKLMRANNAFLGTICAISLLLLQPRRSAFAGRVGGVLGGFVVLFAGLLLASDFGWIGLGINTLFAQDPTHAGHGRVSPEAASTYILVGLVLAMLRLRQKPWSYLVDFLAFSLCLTMANFLASYILGLSHLFNIDPKNPFALQTYILLTVLTFVACTRRAEFGLFSVLLSRGIGGQFARLAAPLALVLPFTFALGNASVNDGGALPDSVVTARSTSLVSLVAFCLVIFLAFRTDRLESKMEETILRDDLTHLYNRRGFSLFADTSLRLAQREGASVFVLFFDMDGLRLVNQTLGHPKGAESLCTMADLLKHTCPSSSIVGRLGGDKFAVTGRGGSSKCADLVRRLEIAAAAEDSSNAQPSPIRYTVGFAISVQHGRQSLDQMTHQAERLMREAKRIKYHQLA